MRVRPLAVASAALLVAAAALGATSKKKGVPARPPGAPQGKLKWLQLTNGTGLGAWTVEGKGRWAAEGGAIVGRQDPTSHSESWLLSRAEFGDFVLVAKFQITSGGNSAVFFRAPKVRGHPGRTGFEMQICDADKRYPTGSIYDLAKAPAGLQRAGEWNRVMVCCIGNQLFTAVNGRVATVVRPKRARSLRGRVGFQIHGGHRYSDMVLRIKDVYVAPIAKPQDPKGGVRFRKVKLDGGMSEGAAILDGNHDGRPDILCGPYWYQYPKWKAHAVRHVATDDYAQSFYELPCDVNADGWTDVIAGGATDAKAEYWFENPRRPRTPWTPHQYLKRQAAIHDMVILDLDGDGRVNDLLPSGEGAIQWIRIAAGPSPDFKIRTIGKKGSGHGIGYGDLNGDGHVDIITPQGWYQAPAKPADRKAKWTWRGEFKLKGKPGVPIRTLDLNSDGAADIVYGNARGYGLWWLEQVRESDAKSTWKEHVIDDTLAQAHSIAIGDINGDGQADLVTGKRWQAGLGTHPGGNEPTCLFWYTHDGSGEGWKRYTIDFNGGAGCGMGLQLIDIDRDDDLDIVAPGKGGLYLFLNLGSDGRRAAMATQERRRSASRRWSIGTNVVCVDQRAFDQEIVSCKLWPLCCSSCRRVISTESIAPSWCRAHSRN